MGIFGQIPLKMKEKNKIREKIIVDGNLPFGNKRIQTKGKKDKRTLMDGNGNSRN